MKFVLEAVATARATTGSQEFADFFNSNGIGTYLSQIRALQLTQLDPDLTGFEGGFPSNTALLPFMLIVVFVFPQMNCLPFSEHFCI